MGHRESLTHSGGPLANHYAGGELRTCPGGREHPQKCPKREGNIDKGAPKSMKQKVGGGRAMHTGPWSTLDAAQLWRHPAEG